MSTKPEIAFVTGASRGIGRAVALKLLEAGYQVAVGYREQSVAAQELARQHKNALSVQLDITSRDSIRRAIQQCENHFGQTIGVLVNNAAIAQEKPFSSITDADWDVMMATNLRSAFIFSQEVLPAMQKKKWGRIINMTSIGGQWGGINQVHYAVAKSGLIGLTRSLARVYSKDGITVNAVAPGLIATDMIVNELQTPAGQEKIRSIPAGRIGAVDDVAGAVLFLMGHDSSYITGQTINVNGGMYFG